MTTKKKAAKKVIRSKTCRGFQRIDFRDIYDTPCSLQQSSLATKDAIWLGADEICKPSGAEPFNSRMHLDRASVRWLVARLNHWLSKGEL